MGSLAVLRLTLTDFRNYPTLRLEPDSRPVVLVGPNGAGKTNLLEAISFLAPGRGLRRAKLSEVTRKGATAWAVAARLAGAKDGDRDIGTGVQPGSERRVLHLDGQNARSQAQLAELAGLLWLTPAMDRLFTEGAGGRRRFLDRLVMGLDPAHGTRAAAYEKALRERAKLLAQGGDNSWLAGLESRMAETGAALAAARRDAVGRLGEACKAGVGPFPAATLTLDGEVERWLETESVESARDHLASALYRSRGLDQAAGGALHGPHRADLLVVHTAKDVPAAQCSTGEQKALLISILLGQARVRLALLGQAPLLLLDEIAAHLDEERRLALFDELCALPAQCWMTGTDAALFTPLGERAQHLRIDDGMAVPE